MSCRGSAGKPKRRRTKAFETNPDQEFEFYLAEKLGKTVDELRGQLSGDEFTRWAVYFGRKEQRHQLAALKAKTRGR
jgi:hypothetical protein